MEERVNDKKRKIDEQYQITRIKLNTYYLHEGWQALTGFLFSLLDEKNLWKWRSYFHRPSNLCHKQKWLVVQYCFFFLFLRKLLFLYLYCFDYKK